MHARTRARALALLVLVVGFCWPALAETGLQGTQERQVGILYDGPWWRAEEVLTSFQTAILELTRGEFEVRFDHSEMGEWTAESVAAAAARLYANEDVDVVLGLGPLAAQQLAQRADHPKPTVCPFALNPALSEFPRQGTGSGLANFNYIAMPTRHERDLQIFYDLVRFEKLAVLLNEPIWSGYDAVRRNFVSALEEKPYEFEVFPIRDDVEGFFAALTPDFDAVLVAPLILLDEERFASLAQGFVERGLPSFSMLGPEDVEAGVLASASPATDLPRLARRVSLHVQAALLGDSLADLPIDMPSGERLTINMRTARAIKFRPTFATLSDADLLHEDARPAGPLMTLRDVAEEAVRVNLALRAEQRAVAAGREAVNQARAQRRPFASVGVSGAQIDEDRAESLFATSAERSLSATLGVSQLIYSDAVNADISIEERRQAQRELDRRSLELETVEAATVAYLDVLRARTLVRIERDNLDLTRQNLELARVRRDVGSAGPSEVYRWESELAGARRSVIDAEAAESKARYSLNQLLNRPQESLINLGDTTLENSGLLVDAKQVGRYVRDPWSFEVLRDFLVARALQVSPEIAALDEAIAASERAVQAARRSFWAPEVSLQGGLTRLIDEGGAGADRDFSLPIPGFELELPDDTSWSLSLEASLPLIAGGQRLAALRQARANLDDVVLTRQSVAEQVELAVRAALRDAASTFASIELSAASADAARKNLDVVADAYSEGTLSILDLLDAQNAALVADQAAATAIYDHLIANLRAQRAVGEFDFFRSDENKADWLRSLDAFYADAGVEVGE